jgi:vacuolar-type H+-ATPase subunit D/Vma8
MASESLLKRFTKVAGQVGVSLTRVDLDVMDRAQMKLVGTIKHLLQDTRLDIRDWEMADSRAEMQRHAREAMKRLEQVRQSILLASEHDIFTAIEIADISAQFDHFAAELQQSFALPDEP